MSTSTEPSSNDTHGAGGNYFICTPSQATAPPFRGTVTVRDYDPAMCLNSDAVAKEEKRKADHSHNLRLQKARKHGGKMTPW